MNKIKKINYLRRFVQISSIFLFFYLLKRTEFPVSEKFPVNFYFRTDTLMAISSTLISWHLSRYFLPAIFLFVSIVVLGNFFCFWFCPLGGMIDLGNAVFLRKKWNFFIEVSSKLRKTRFFILAGVLILSFLGFFFKKMPYIVWLFDPFVILTRAIVVKKEWLILFLIVLFTSFLIPRFWCNNFCPLGALYHFLGVKIRNLVRRVGRKWKNGEKRFY